METITTSHEAVKYMYGRLHKGMPFPVSDYFAMLNSWFAKNLAEDTACASRAIPMEHWEMMLHDMAPKAFIYQRSNHSLTRAQIRFIASLLAFFAVSDPDCVMPKEQIIIAMINSLEWGEDKITFASGVLASSSAFEKLYKVRFNVKMSSADTAGTLADLGKAKPEWNCQFYY